IGVMYSRDGRAVGPVWATFLSFIRSCVYTILAVVFLLPAEQSWEEAKSRSSVVVLVDATQSMQISDASPTADVPLNKLPRRMDLVLEFFGSPDKAFLANLARKNPVNVYRF